MISLSFLVSPAVGAAIGYLTNALAVKMLFRPYSEKRIGRLRLPFTPGVIPRRRKALARALGDAVGRQLVTQSDLREAILSDTALDALTDLVLASISGRDGLEKQLGALLGEKELGAAKERLDGALTSAIVSALSSADLGGILLREGAAAVRRANPMLGMFLGDAMIEQLSPTVNASLDRYLSERGEKELLPSVSEQSERWLSESPAELLSGLGLDEKAQRALIGGAVRRLLCSCLPTLLEGIDLASIVERKIEAMEIRELESLVLSVMRRELRAVVNLGAVIGFILGLLGAFL
ncbi:MAG: DUF445 family protein [Clostridia bacterium]|nr:DUF445 family protein [Clostridia bacterium]